MEFEAIPLADSEVKPPPCKGLYYRVRVSRYRSSNGVIAHRREYRPLQRLSCHGCARCDWMWDALADADYKFLDGGKDGDVVRLVMANISHDPESGYVDDFDLAFTSLPPSGSEKSL